MKKVKVSKYTRNLNGKNIKVNSFKRKARPKKMTGIKKADTVRYKVTYYRDRFGRLTSKRDVKVL